MRWTWNCYHLQMGFEGRINDKFNSWDVQEKKTVLSSVGGHYNITLPSDACYEVLHWWFKKTKTHSLDVLGVIIRGFHGALINKSPQSVQAFSATFLPTWMVCNHSTLSKVFQISIYLGKPPSSYCGYQAISKWGLNYSSNCLDSFAMFCKYLLLMVSCTYCWHIT